MENPFPGMNPYLEQSWRDIHHRVVTYACDQIADKLPRDLRARIDERVFVESDDQLPHSIYPDVRVVERPAWAHSGVPPGGELLAAEPLVVRIESDPVREGFIQIIEAGSGDRVITVIEFLSLSNKAAGEGQDQYRRKQRECKAAHVSLVEIDLLRAGGWVMAVPQSLAPRVYRGPYRLAVMRGWNTSSFELYRVALRERLPAIRVPLRQTDADIALELQPLIDQAYRNGVYDDIDYRRDPEPPLDAEDAAWTVALLKEKGLR